MKKKIIIILVVILVLIIALAASVGAMVVTGKIALTSGQKMVKGLSEIGDKLSMETSEIEETSQYYQKKSTTPFKEQTTITASLDEFKIAELDAINGMDKVITELIDTVENSTITNTLEADYGNNIINESISLELGDIIEKISANVEYDNNRLSFVSKELNEKYITFTKNELQSSDEYSEYLTAIEKLEELCEAQSKINLTLTDEEKAHWTEYYGDILLNYITSDMLVEEKTTITVDGVSKGCSEVSFTLNKTQIAELMGNYLKTLEEDTTGKAMIIERIQLVYNDFTEDDLLEFIENIKTKLLNLDEDVTVKISVYCTNFETYGFGIEINEDTNDKITAILGDSTHNLYIYEDDVEVMNVVNTENNMTMSFNMDEMAISINVDKINNQSEISVEYLDDDNELKFNCTITSVQVTNTDTTRVIKNTVNIYLEEDEDIIELTLNINDELEYVNSIDVTTFNNSNSLNLVTATEEELSNYLTEVMTNGNAIIEKAQESKLVKVIMYYYNQYEQSLTVYNEMDTETSLQASATFNATFENYEGRYKSSVVKSLLQSISSSNNAQSTISGHIITVKIEDEYGFDILSETTDSTSILNSMTSIESTSIYSISMDKDDAGYINKVIISKE